MLYKERYARLKGSYDYAERQIREAFIMQEQIRRMIIEDIHKELHQDKEHLEELKTEELFKIYDKNSK